MFAPNISTLIAARAVEGLGAGFAVQWVLARLAAGATPRRCVVLLGGAMGAAAVVAPVLGGVLAGGVPRPWILALAVPDLAGAALALGRASEPAGRRSRVDVEGVLLVAFGVVGVLVGLTASGASGWRSPWALAPLAAGAALLAAFTRYELPVGGVWIREFLSLRIATYFLFASLWGATFLLAQFFQADGDPAPLEAGLRLTPWTAALMVGLPLVGRRADRVVTRRLLVGGLLLGALGLGWLAWGADRGLSYALMLPPMVIGGSGLSLAVIGVRTAADSSSARGTPSRRDCQTAMLLRLVSGAIGVALFGTVLARAGGGSSPQLLDSDFALAIGLAAAFALFGALAALGIPGRRVARSVRMRAIELTGGNISEFRPRR